MAFRETSVKFLNSTDKPLTVRPIKSSSGRFNSFTLSPGESSSVRDSFSGLQNYDIEWDVLVNPKGSKNDALVGQFRADNPWSSSAYVGTLDKGVKLAFESNASCMQGVGKTQYYADTDLGYSANNKSAGYFGVFDRSRTFECTTLLFPTDSSGTFSRGFLDAFDHKFPYAKVVSQGVKDDAYSFMFEVKDF